ncbi:MAG TPA: NAD-glutamate dehydrogenase, partial [Caulobacteraceae bacterium]
LQPVAPACKIADLERAFATALETDAKSLSDAQRLFLRQVHEDCAAEEVGGAKVADIGKAVAELWRFGQKPTKTPRIRVRRWKSVEGEDLRRDLLEIAQDDRPFLVDSVMGEIAAGNYAVRAMFHPIADLGKGRRRSLIQVHLDPVGEDRTEALIQAVSEVLDDVIAAVEDFGAMRELLRRSIDDLAQANIPGSEEEREESLAFLRWLEGERFVFLGARIYAYPRTEDGGYANEEPLDQPEDSLGVLRDPDRAVLRRTHEPAVLSKQLRRHLETDAPLIVAKANLRSRVHRRTHMDYVGIKRYGPDGKPSGEVRLVGLFTAEAYDASARDVPFIRRKVAQIIENAPVAPSGHNEKRLRNIVETYPRDELFQASVEELAAIAAGILHLYDRPRVRLFVRRDPFDRFVSVLFFSPRDRYDTRVRERVGDMIAAAWDGEVAAHYPSFSDTPLVRVHYIIKIEPGHHARPNIARLEARVAEATRTWEDRFEAQVRDGGVPAAQVADMLARYQHAFPAGYRDRYGAAEALADIAVVDAIDPDGPARVRAYRLDADEAIYFRFKLYRPGAAAPLAEVLPILEHMGLKAIIEEGFPISPSDRPRVWVHEFLIEDRAGEDLVFADVCAAFEAAFVAVWTGRTESDGFNRLVLELGISWREAALVRALARYRQQSGFDPSQAVQEAALSDHPDVARLILELFAVKFDPARKGRIEARRKAAEARM